MNEFRELKPRGARIVFLDPIPWEVLERCGPILRVISLEAPRTVGDVVVITSHYRRPTPLSRFSWHHTGDALDWRTGVEPEIAKELGAIVAETRAERFAIAEEWVDRVAVRLGSEYDLVGPRDPNHIDHGHAERDGRKAARVYKKNRG